MVPGTDIVVMDYVISALAGFNSEAYLPGSFACVNNTKYFEIDTTHTLTNYRANPNAFSALETGENVVFNTTGTLSGYLPDAIYYCYFLPSKAVRTWTSHYQSFNNL